MPFMVTQMVSPFSTPLKIFSDTEFVKKALTWERFAVVENVQVRRAGLNKETANACVQIGCRCVVV